MDQFVGASATDTIKNMIGTGTAANPLGSHWGSTAANATQLERADTVKALQYRINAGIDSPRVVGSPVMAYSPRTKTNETPLDKKLHGVIDENGNVTELPQYASWQWALLFHQAGVNDVDSYFELVSFIGGPAAKTYGGVTESNNNWPAKTAPNGTRTVVATQAIRNLGLGTATGEEWVSESANLIARGGYIQDYQQRGLDPVAVILPGYIQVSDEDTIYIGVTGSNADYSNLTTPVRVGAGTNEVKSGTYPVKQGLEYATSGVSGGCGYNQLQSVISEIWTQGYDDFGINNAIGLYNLRSLTYLGSSSITTSWGNSLGANYGSKLASLYYNASDPALKSAFNANTSTFKTNNQSLIDKPTRLQPILANTFDPIISLPPSSYYPLLHHQK